MTSEIDTDPNVLKMAASMLPSGDTNEAYCDPMYRVYIVKKTMHTGILYGQPELCYVVNQILKDLPPVFVKVSTNYRFNPVENLFTADRQETTLFSRGSATTVEGLVNWMRQQNLHFSSSDLMALMGYFSALIYELDCQMIFHHEITPKNLLLLDNKLKLVNPLFTDTFFHKLTTVDNVLTQEVATPLVPHASLLDEAFFNIDTARRHTAENDSSCASAYLSHHKSMATSIRQCFVTLLSIAVLCPDDAFYTPNGDIDVIKVKNACAVVYVINQAMNHRYDKRLADLIVMIVLDHRYESFCGVDFALASFGGHFKEIVLRNFNQHMLTSDSARSEAVGYIREFLDLEQKSRD